MRITTIKETRGSYLLLTCGHLVPSSDYTMHGNWHVEGVCHECYPVHHICTECGEGVREIEWMEPVKTNILTRKLCFTCLFWLEKVEYPWKGSNRIQVIVKGHHYQFKYPQPDGPAAFSGFGGADFYIKMFDGTLYHTNNMWTQGDIPDHFRERLSDNAVFITKEEYDALQKEN